MYRIKVWLGMWYFFWYSDIFIWVSYTELSQPNDEKNISSTFALRGLFATFAFDVELKWNLRFAFNQNKNLEISMLSWNIFLLQPGKSEFIVPDLFALINKS